MPGQPVERNGPTVWTWRWPGITRIGWIRKTPSQPSFPRFHNDNQAFYRYTRARATVRLRSYSRVEMSTLVIHPTINPWIDDREAASSRH